MNDKIKKIIQTALKNLNIEGVDFSLEHPADASHGDFATNIALAASKKVGKNPRELAVSIKTEIEKIKPDFISKIEIAGPGFINFFLSDSVYVDELKKIIKDGKKYGTSVTEKGKKVIVEYGNPNPFKEFHIGHVVNAVIGEAIFHLMEVSGAKVKRVSYHGDVGPQIAKAVWGMKAKISEYPKKSDSLQNKAAFLGSCYALGSKAYEEKPEIKVEIDILNKKIFENSDKEVYKLYKEGRNWSFAAFDEVFGQMNITPASTRFLESEISEDGIKIVREFLKKGIFEESESAVVFHAENFDPKLHTRVFINSQGLPTYEAKELGLTQKKFKKIDPDISIVITGNEQVEYFKVVLKAMEFIDPNWVNKTKHISHGFLRLSSGKMSSREGGVITGDSLIRDVEVLVSERIKDRGFNEKEKQEVIKAVSIAAIKYSILKQVTSSDIIFDFEKSISFEGDSGPYLLYTAVRANSVLEKAKKEGISPKLGETLEISPLQKYLVKFPEVVSRSALEKAPHFIATYLIELASLFNAWYANNPIVVKGGIESPSRVFTTKAVRTVLENGLSILGIKIPEKM